MEETVDPIISKEDMANLLGRPLKALEDSNYDLYLNIATSWLLRLTCIDVGEFPPDPFPEDLQLVLSQLFAAVPRMVRKVDSGSANVSSKRVEDFQITYREDAGTAYDEIVSDFAYILTRYSECGLGIRSGRTDCHDGLRCI